jgi:hypothetical protein
MQTPIGIAFDAVNHRIYIADSGTSTILAYDLDGNVASGWTPPSVPQITGIAFSPSANHVLATSQAGSGAVLVFDASGAPVANAGFTGLHAPPIGIADGANDQLIAVVEAGNPGYLDVFDPTGNADPNYSSQLFDAFGTPFAPTGVGAADSVVGSTFDGDHFFVSGMDGTNPTTALYTPVLGFVVEGFYLWAPYTFIYGGTIDRYNPGAGPVTNPLSNAYSRDNGDIYVVDTGGLRGYTCDPAGCAANHEPASIQLPEAKFIPAPAGLPAFTAAAFEHT